MRAIFRHDLKSYFTAVTGYVLGALLLLSAGIYTMVINLNAGQTNFEYVLSNMSFVFLVAVPILTMRVLAEERRQKTDQLLYSLPISMTEVAVGKYLAMLVMFLIPTCIIGIIPLLLTSFGNVYLPAAMGSLVGFFLLGAALLAIGMFISSLTESQAVAAGLCFVVMLVNYFVSSLSAYVSTSAFSSYACVVVLALILAAVFRIMTKSGFVALMLAAVLIIGLTVCFVLWSSSFESLFPNIMDQLSLFDRFYQFVNGVFDLRAVVYFLTVIGIFLFLCVQSLEKRRWSA